MPRIIGKIEDVAAGKAFLLPLPKAARLARRWRKRRKRRGKHLRVAVPVIGTLLAC